MLIKRGIDISFAQGLDQKTDPKRVAIGNFVRLENTIFDIGGLLQKRNGYQELSSLPDTTYSYLTTYNNNLTAIGNNIAAYNSANTSWVTKGAITPITMNTLPLLRNNLNQTQCDSAVAANGLVCTAYLETDGTTVTNKYVISDSITGQNVVAPTAIPISSGAVSGGMRVFLLSNNFIIVFTNTITGTAHLQYIAISTQTPTSVSANTDIAAAYTTATTLAWDGVVAGNNLYVAYNTTSGGQAVKVVILSNILILSVPTTFSGYTATLMSLTADTTSSVTVYISFYNSGSSTGFTAAVDANINVILNPVRIIGSGTILNMASAAQNGSCKVFYEVSNAYSFDAGIPSNFINSVTVTPSLISFNSVFSSGSGTITASSAAGLVNGMYLVDNTTPANIPANTSFTVSGTTLTLSNNTAGNSLGSPGDVMAAATLSSVTTIVRSVGLASKTFINNGAVYFLSAYQSAYQPTYFLINGTTSLSSRPVVVAKLAYSNGGGYLTKGLPSVSINSSGSTIRFPYLYKDMIAAVNKNTNVPAGTQTAGIYSQTGINLATITFEKTTLDTAEIGNNLHLSGGYLSMYDGQAVVEHNFFLWPDTDTTTPTDFASWSATGGSIVAKPDGSTNVNAYYYQVTYEWTDNAGNAFRSAPSIPIPVTTTGSGTAGSITLNIPTLRLTAKTSSAVKIVIYRWSVGQQIYYQVTSITSPTLNSTTIDSVTYIDTSSDATILGNNILYTTGGVVEDINAPATNVMTLFDTRLWLVDAEDRNLLWYSKQVIEATPVEMSDLFTIYVAPTTGAQGSTGPITALSVLDDKLIIFKKDAIYYINGIGGDNTGANSQYSEPIFITSTVGCANQQSIVFMPDGLMFQSDKGIWLLGRGLQTSYIGAQVQTSVQAGTVLSAQNIPETNQVRFVMSTGALLMYDYFYHQWGTFTGIPAISSTIYGDLHTFINSYGAVYQENPGSYLDGSNPVLMRFTTGPIRLGDLQNYQRVYFFYLLGQFLSPIKLVVSISYDYSPNPSQSTVITPTNSVLTYGHPGPYGQGNPYGGPISLLDWRVFVQRQRCMAFAIDISEIYDPTYGILAGAGFTLSGINAVCGFKGPFRPQAAQHSVG